MVYKDFSTSHILYECLILELHLLIFSALVDPKKNNFGEN